MSRPLPTSGHAPATSRPSSGESTVTFAATATYGFSIEIPNAEWSARMARALQDNYGFSDQAVRWFTMHAALDAGHGEEFRRHARKVAEQPGGLKLLREKTLAFAQVVKNLWNGHGRWQRPPGRSAPLDRLQRE